MCNSALVGKLYINENKSQEKSSTPAQQTDVIILLFNCLLCFKDSLDYPGKIKLTKRKRISPISAISVFKFSCNTLPYQCYLIIAASSNPYTFISVNSKINVFFTVNFPNDTSCL